GFHSKQEFPDYPYVNADYDLVKENLEQIKKEIFRFAGEKSFAKAVVTHWGPISREGCLALRDGGIKIMSVTRGDKNEYNNDPSSLPYGHAQRLLHNRKPETGVYCRNNGDKAIDASICGYNHLTSDKFDPIVYNFKTYYDDRINMHFKKFCNGPCLNLVDYDKLDEAMSTKLNNEYFGYATHEQYFYEDYFAYQPDCENKLYKVAKTLMENGYTHFFAEELA
ncbi:MAG: hypothetical protein IJ454_02645, partial [Clostridia bacterium]|nr:hypothetical protein [Clostridia bacterium]